MKTLILAGATAMALALSPAALSAQSTTATNTMAATMSAAQRTMYNGWTAENRSAYDAWPSTLQTYYWTLTPDQQSGWWMLTDAQRAKVYAMTPEQRAAAWTAIHTQMMGAQNNMASSSSSNMASMSNGATMQWVSTPMVESVPTDTAPANPPICAPNQQDNCINAWEAGKRGPGARKPLPYWPGKPASEM